MLVLHYILYCIIFLIHSPDELLMAKLANREFYLFYEAQFSWFVCLSFSTLLKLLGVTKHKTWHN